MKKLLTLIYVFFFAGTLFGQDRELPPPDARWEASGYNLYLSPPSSKLAIGTAKFGNEYLSLACPTITMGNTTASGIKSTGSSNGQYFSGDVEGSLVSSENWNSQGQGFGIMGNLTLRRSGGTQNSVSAGGLFNLTMTSTYSTFGSGIPYSGAVISRLRGTVGTFPTNGILASLIALDDIKSPSTYAGYFDGRSYFSNNVGIGVKDPTHKLDVAGTIRATEILVEAQTADFVFEENYRLRSLEEVERFIIKNKHLPEIPNAAQMKAEGANLAEMNKLLLMKIEELTLYMIEQQKTINGLKEAISAE